MDMLLVLILLPLVAAACVFCVPRGTRFVKEGITLLATALNLGVAVSLLGADRSLSLPWLGNQLEFSLRWYNLSAFIVVSAAALSFLVVLFSSVYAAGKAYAKQFYAYLLISLSFVNGAVLADNLVVLLFFWEGLLATTFGLIAIGGGKGAARAAIKALIIVGLTDLCLMLGIALCGRLAGTLAISKINLPLAGAGSAAFVLLMIGAISKAGSMPFHSWIPDAALDAPLPFMAFMPGSLEKLIGIYFLARICLDMFVLTPASGLSALLMWVGGLTILFAVMMALIQKDYRKLLAYHAISQVGYMILGIGTMVPAGIVGGLFHMINNALYKSGLFLTAGAVERQAGTADLRRLGGLRVKMPVTFACFLILAASISGVPPFNGFFSKELVYDGALERGWIFYFLAVAGSFFTAASFLKLGHAAYFGQPCADREKVKEAPFAMLAPMVAIAACCVLFGLYNALPIKGIIEPIVGAHRLEGRSFAGFPANAMLITVTVAVLLAALVNHILGARSKGCGIKAVDHIHYAPGLHWVYDRAERGWFDPYVIGFYVTGALAKLLWFCDRAVDWIYESFAVKVTYFFSEEFRRSQPGNFPGYLVWSLVGMALVVVFLMRFVTGG